MGSTTMKKEVNYDKKKWRTVVLKKKEKGKYFLKSIIFSKREWESHSLGKNKERRKVN